MKIRCALSLLVLALGCHPASRPQRPDPVAAARAISEVRVLKPASGITAQFGVRDHTVVSSPLRSDGDIQRGGRNRTDTQPAHKGSSH